MIKMGIGSILCDMNGKVLNINSVIEFQFSHILGHYKEPTLFQLFNDSLGYEALESFLQVIEDCGEFQVNTIIACSSKSWTDVCIYGQSLNQPSDSVQNQFILILISPSNSIRQSYQYSRPYSHVGDPKAVKPIDKVIITDANLKIAHSMSSSLSKDGIDHLLLNENSVLDNFPRHESWNIQVAASKVLNTGNPQRLTATNNEGGRCLVSVFKNTEIQNKDKLVWMLVDETHVSQKVSEIAGENSLLIQLANSSSDVFWVFDIEIASIVYISPSYAKIWGRSTEKLYLNSKDFIEGIHHDDISQMYESMNHQAKGIKTVTEYRVVRPDGSMTWVRDRAFPIREISGKIRFITGIAEDITAEKEQSLELASIESRMIKLNDNLPTGVLRLDHNLIIQDANIAATNMLNSSQHNLKHQSIFNFLDDDEVHAEISNWILNRDSESIEIATEIKGCHQRSLNALLRLVAEGAENPANSFLIILTDVTLLSRTIGELRNAKSKMEFVMESGLSGHWEYNLDERKIKLSQGCCEILGSHSCKGAYDLKEVLKKIAKDSRRQIYEKSRELIFSSTNGETCCTLELNIEGALGDYKCVLNHIKLFERIDKQRNYKFLTGLVTDITAQRLAEDAALEYKKQITESELGNSKIEILAAIAHEINQPLFAIQNFSISLRNILKNNSTNNNYDDMEYFIDELIENIIKQSERGGQIMRRLRDLSAEKQQAHSPIDLHEQIQTIYKFREVYIQPKKVEFSLKLNAEKYLCLGDEMKYQLILINLIKNASEAFGHVINNKTPQERSGMIVISTHTDEDELIIGIKDQGGGIKDASVDIYNPFYSTKQGGMGIGLSICKSIVESMNGRIWHENSTGQGVTFYLAFKLINNNISN